MRHIQGKFHIILVGTQVYVLHSKLSTTVLLIRRLTNVNWTTDHCRLRHEHDHFSCQASELIFHLAVDPRTAQLETLLTFQDFPICFKRQEVIDLDVDA